MSCYIILQQNVTSFKCNMRDYDSLNYITLYYISKLFFVNLKLRNFCQNMTHHTQYDIILLMKYLHKDSLKTK